MVTQNADEPVIRGNFVLVVSSLPTRAHAESFGLNLQANGIDYEIIEIDYQRYWVSVGCFDTLDEAARHTSQMKSKPYCEDVWVARRPEK